MTRDQLLTMPAGPETDQWIAENIRLRTDDPVSVLPYSTDLVAAFKVVDFFVKNGTHFNMGHVSGHSVANYGARWFAQFDCCFPGVADTIPFAICRAAAVYVFDEGGK